jgi:sarcosine oxidase
MAEQLRKIVTSNLNQMSTSIFGKELPEPNAQVFFPMGKPLAELSETVGRKIARQGPGKQDFDVIVAGTGSMGAATCYQLARRGLRVLGLEQYDLPHELGSHGGQSRIIRQSYYEHPDYVPLLLRAYENWRELEERSGSRVYFPTGLLYLGRREHTIMQGVRRSAGEHGLDLRQPTITTARASFPQFAIPDGFEVLFEPEAGFLTPERAILLFADEALKMGAELRTREKVLHWSHEGSGISLWTDKGSYRARKLVIAGGAWAASLVPRFSNLLTVTRQVLTWVEPLRRTDFELGKFPCWLFANPTGEGAFYGFPILPEDVTGGPAGLKLALHLPGEPCDPDLPRRQPDAADEEVLTGFLRTFIPDGYQFTHLQKTCLYTNSPDEHFILDLLPETDGKVAVAAGFSGHGFKFAAVIGEIMADLAADGDTKLPIGFLRAGRFLAK